MSPGLSVPLNAYLPSVVTNRFACRMPDISCVMQRFHQVLTDISLGKDSNSVRKFIVASFVRGINYSAETCGFEGRADMCISFYVALPSRCSLNCPASLFRSH